MLGAEPRLEQRAFLCWRGKVREGMHPWQAALKSRLGFKAVWKCGLLH